MLIVIVGVLTKPDRMPADDSIDTWREILEGSIFGVGHSYYVTKQTSQSFLNKISHKEARIQEVEFFETTQPWNTELSEFKNRFGTSRLQKVLSQKLTEKILARYASEISYILNCIVKALKATTEKYSFLDAWRIICADVITMAIIFILLHLFVRSDNILKFIFVIVCQI